MKVRPCRADLYSSLVLIPYQPWERISRFSPDFCLLEFCNRLGEQLLILKSSLFCLPLPGPRFAPVATPGAMPEPGLRQHGREARGHPGRGLTDGPP